MGGCEERENGVGRTKKRGERKALCVCVCVRERERAGERECVWL